MKPTNNEADDNGLGTCTECERDTIKLTPNGLCFGCDSEFESYMEVWRSYCDDDNLHYDIDSGEYTENNPRNLNTDD